MSSHEIVVQSSEPIGLINPRLHGIFIEPWTDRVSVDLPPGAVLAIEAQITSGG
jgi:hypothetical protein